MSAPGNLPPPPAPRTPYSGGQVAMLVIGGVMLLPGLCSILLALSMVQDIKNSFNEPIMQLLMIAWGMCVAISLAGVILIVLAWRGARKRR
jgi:hypothetical protein